MTKFRSLAAVMCALSVTSISGCGGTDERPVEELSRARTLIQQAEQTGAQRFAGADLERARQQLREAERADKTKDGEDARRMAVQAGLDAELASAKTRQAKAEQAAQEVASSTESLQKEAERGADRAEQQLTQPPQ